MTDSELFKYDIRVRERMLRKKLIDEGEVEQRLQALPDLESKCLDIELKQPALHRHDDSPPAPRLTSAAAAAASMQAFEAPRAPEREPAPADDDDLAESAGDEPFDDEADDDEADDDEADDDEADDDEADDDEGEPEAVQTEPGTEAGAETPSGGDEQESNDADGGSSGSWGDEP